MNKVKFGTFYTEGPYEEVFKTYLLPSCEKFGIEPLVVKIKNQGSWLKNVAEKPNAILELLKNHITNGECLVFLDADATLESYPKLFEEIPLENELAYHTLNWNEWYLYKNNPPVMELLTGTMFFRHSANIESLCNDWYNDAKTSNTWEQQSLAQVIKRYTQIKVFDLPVTYTYMKTLPDGREPNVKETPIILHHQKSRELKRRVN